MGGVFVGTSGWNYKHWREVVYPPRLPAKDWLRFYGARFGTVEVNNSFYRLPPAETFAAWAAQVPPGFVFAVKASRYLTHMKKLKEPEGPLAKILGHARHLGDHLGGGVLIWRIRIKPRKNLRLKLGHYHLGPVLYQLPPHWRCDVARLRTFLAALPADLRHAVEFRDPSWYVEEVRDLLAEFGVGFCIHDLRGAACPDWVTGPLVYLRFHGPTAQAYAGSYPDAHLKRWAGRIGEFRDRGRSVYAYFNNDHAGYAVANARTLREMLQLNSVPVAAGAVS